MPKLWFASLMLVAAFTPAIPCMNSLHAADDVRSTLEKRVFKNDAGETLPYRLFVPKNYDASQKYPLIVFLHGAGERGGDNEAQLKHAQVLRFASDEVQAKHPAFIVAPQCPATRLADGSDDHKWSQFNFRESGKGSGPILFGPRVASVGFPRRWLGGG